MDLAVLIGSERFDPKPAIPHLVQHNEHIPFLKAQLICLWHFGEGKHSHHFSPIINRLKNAHRINFSKFYCKHTLTYSCEICNYILDQLFHRGNFFFLLKQQHLPLAVRLETWVAPLWGDMNRKCSTLLAEPCCRIGGHQCSNHHILLIFCTNKKIIIIKTHN